MVGTILLAMAIMTSQGEIRVDCADPGPWTFALDSSGATGGVETVRVTMKSGQEAPPPRFSIAWFVPQTGIHHVWTSESTHYGIPWNAPMCSELASSMPVYAMLDANDNNKFAFACSESCRRVVFRSPISETKMGFDCSFEFFTVPEAAMREYAVEIRLDSRRVFYGEAIGDAAEWIVRAAGIEPLKSPEAAFDPLYSTWYDFHQDVSAEGVERECALAAALGMKTVIVDDGWQIDLPLGNRPWNGYRLCGDWEPGRHFSDMAAHVKRVQDMGFRYMMWYSVPFVGKDSRNFNRFKGMFLPVECAGGVVLDPRFPEVREFIVKTYENAVREWNIDGLKLDFIGRFALKDGVADPAVAENYAGRDIRSIPLAVDLLLTTVMERLKALKPDILIEFRQPYVGPGIRRFGNMLRASDCPLSMVENRTRIARLRLTSGKTSVHSDMLEWRNDETAESAARCILNAIFGVVQYSLHLGSIPERHRAMMSHWIRFSTAHREALVKGAFRPHYPASDYPLLEGESTAERIFGVYQDGLVVDAGAPDRPVYILNGANATSLPVEFRREPARIEAYDTFGNMVAVPVCGAGLNRISVPISGFVRIEWGKPANVAAEINLECESFDDCGGWSNDTQFMDQMGSPYLIAHGLGKPVANAVTSFTVVRPGTYRVFARTMNWTARWSESPAGVFRILVDGAELPADLGAGGSDWAWQMAGEATLKAGTHRIELQDLTGFDARCDAICLTQGDAPLLLPRAKASGFETSTCDLVVVGGGIAGICTAVSAARLGLSVALINDRPVLGGNNSSEVRVHLGAWQNMPPYPRLGDVLAEFGPRKGGNAESADTYEDGRKLDIVRAETNITLVLNCRITGAETNVTGAITSVSGVDTRTGRGRRFAAKWFSDCTGDGAVGFLAGADFRMGREARNETDEPWAPEKPDMLTMGASVQWRAHRACSTVAFPIRPWMIRFDDTNGRAEMKGDWDWESGLGRDQIVEAERVRDYGLLVAYSNWAYVKNVSRRKDEFRDAELEWVAYIAGRRESRRLMGDFILTERHVRNRDYQLDGTCAATWTIDLHFPKTKDQTNFDGEPFRANSENEKTWPYPIPYRCYYSRNVPNLFMAGRDISVTHVALGTTRLMRTHGMMGEVVGMAASLCKRYGCDPRDVYRHHLDELKELMRKGVGDGRPHPLQMYNIQTSLDPRFRDFEKGNLQIR